MRLWNPMAAAYWSLLLTPMFAATLLDKNWRELGEPDSARQTRFLMWATGFFALLSIISAFIDTSQSTDKLIQGVSKIVGLVLTAFCFSIGRRQRDLLKASGVVDYKKRLWGKAIAFGLFGVLGFIGLISLGVLFFSHPVNTDVAAETQVVVSTFFQQNPAHKVTTVNKVQIDRREGNDYFGTAELTLNGGRVRQPLHVHLENGQLQWEIAPPASAGITK